MQSSIVGAKNHNRYLYGEFDRKRDSIKELIMLNVSMHNFENGET